MKKYRRNNIISIGILLVLTISTLTSVLLTNLGNFNLGLNNNLILPDNELDSAIKSSGTYYTGMQYTTSDWWNSSYSKRIGFNIENDNNFDRYEPVDVYFEFDDDEFYEGTQRLVPYDNNTEIWSDPIPVQLWNITLWSEDYIKSCTIKFISKCDYIGRSRCRLLFSLGTYVRPFMSFISFSITRRFI